MNIFIAPVSFSNTSFLNKILPELKRYLNSFDVSFINLPLEIESSYSAERGQYFSTALIAETIKLTDEYSGKILVLVEFDLFVPVFTYVFGEAQLNGKHAIVSVCRLHEEFHSGETNDELLLERSLKEILHELGHTFGLIHCRDWECVMHVSQGIEEIDIKGKGFCHLCLNKILSQTS